MPSKYEHIFSRLKHVRSLDASHQERVDVVKTAIEAAPEFKRQGTALASEYAELRREKATIERALSECQVRLDAVTQLMEDQFEVEGATAMTLDNGDNVRFEPGIHPKVIDPEAFRLWCLADKDLAKKMVLNAMTAQSLVRQMLLAGEAEPPGVEAVVWNKVVFRKGL